MEQFINTAAIFTMVVGFVAIIALSVAIITWTVRSVIRWVVEMRYAISVKYYIKDTHERIVDYDKRIKAIEEAIPKLEKKILESWRF